MHLSKRRLIILAFSLISLALMVGALLYWESERWAEQRLQEYIRRLEETGFSVEERALSDFHVNGSVRIYFFGDFRSFAEQEGVNRIYYDRGIHALYFLRPASGGIEANIFYYK
jgi:hypothetical protein